MLNKMILMGRLTREPELRHTADGVPVANFSIAHERAYRNGDEEKVTDFYDVVAWRSTAEFAAKWLSKGRLVIISGKTQVRRCLDLNGNKRTKFEIVADEVYFADSKRESTAPAAETSMEGCNETELPMWEELAGEDAECPFL